MKNIPIRQIASAQLEHSSANHFKIRNVEDLLDRDDLFHELHRHDFFFIIALIKGEGTHEIDFKAYKVFDHSIFFMRPGQVHQLQLKSDSTGFIIEFSRGFYRPENKLSIQRLRKASNKDYCKLETDRFEKIYTVLTRIFQEYTEKEQGYEDAIMANLDIFLIEFLRQSPNPKDLPETANPYIQDRFDELSELLDGHIATLKLVNQYTDLMNLSHYQLNEITKASVGKTTSELINEHIMLEAKRYLLATTNQVKEIADQLGYQDVSYFIRFFKKHSGLSPESFRHNHR